MLLQDDLGREEGTEVGPEAGKGAVIFTCTGEQDFDGLPGDALPPMRTTAERYAQPELADALLAASAGQMV